jgi:hypothetical protein
MLPAKAKARAAIVTVGIQLCRREPQIATP